MERKDILPEIREFLLSYDIEDIRKMWESLRVASPGVIMEDNPRDWFRYLKPLSISDEIASDMYSDGLRIVFGDCGEVNDMSLSELQDKVLSGIDYDARHRDKLSKSFMESGDFSRYHILEEVRDKWYKKWKR